MCTAMVRGLDFGPDDLTPKEVAAKLSGWRQRIPESLLKEQQ